MRHWMGNEYYTIQEAAWVLDIRPGSLYRLTHEGRLETLRLGGRHHVTLEQVRAAATKRRTPKPKQPAPLRVRGLDDDPVLREARAIGVRC